MSDYYTEKALLATNNKIDSHLKQSNFFKRNLWKVIGFGIFASIWAPTFMPENYLQKRKSALELSGLSYWELVIITAIVYTSACLLAHFVWKIQEKLKLKKLIRRKRELELKLGILINS